MVRILNWIILNISVVEIFLEADNLSDSKFITNRSYHATTEHNLHNFICLHADILNKSFMHIIWLSELDLFYH